MKNMNSVIFKNETLRFSVAPHPGVSNGRAINVYGPIRTYIGYCRCVLQVCHCVEADGSEGETTILTRHSAGEAQGRRTRWAKAICSNQRGTSLDLPKKHRNARRHRRLNVSTHVAWLTLFVPASFA